MALIWSRFLAPLPAMLDVTFREDNSRVRDHHAARNFAVLRKIALNPGATHEIAAEAQPVSGSAFSLGKG
jgi:hypothetical protein